jgi:sugar O-acyltransferase (sialic acid O-acetyltransferase NeuD family)
MSKEKIVLIGGGGHCISVIDVIELQNKYLIAGIVDTNEKSGTEILGYKIFSSDDNIPELVREYKNFHISMGFIRSAEKRIEFYRLLKSHKAILPVIISPLAYVSKHASLGEGSIIMHMSFVNSLSRVGVNCIINTKAIVEHGAIIGNHCHVSTGAKINGDVELGERSFFGSGAVSKQGIVIPPGSFIKANSVVK